MTDTTEQPNDDPSAWMTLSPEPDITAYDLWRCFSMGQSLNPDEAKGIPEELKRHYKPRPPPGEY